MKKVGIIGGGFAGCAAAHQFTLKGGFDVTLIESNSMLGAGVRTHWWGGHPYTFGPRHFLTPHEHVFAYLNKYVPLRRCAEHQALTYVEQDSEFYNFPIHVDDISRMPDREIIEQEILLARGAESARNLEEYWIGSVGKTLYGKFVDKYNKKMWLLSDNKLHDTFNWSAKGVALKRGPRAFWSEWISAYPFAQDGYNQYFDIATQNVQVRIKTKIDHFDLQKRRLFYDGQWNQFDIIINTISIDDLFDHCYGQLQYVGVDLQLLVLPIEFAFPADVYFLYYANSEPFKRLVEYKRFTQHKSKHTLLGIETPSRNGRYYPLPIKSEKARASRYLELLPHNVFSIGRAGTYEYLVDIDDCIKQAMDLIDYI